MNPYFLVEQLGPRQRVVARHRLTGCTAYIGRGYDNDLVLDDPQVAPRHLTVCPKVQGGFHVITHPEAPLYLERTGARLDGEATVDGHDILRLGQTRLRLRSPDHPVSKAVEVTSFRLAGFLTTGALLAMAVLIYALGEWAHAALIRPYWHYVPEQWPQLMIAFFWVAFWSLLNRLLYQRAQWEFHARVAAWGLFWMATVIHLPGPVAYSLSLTPPPYLENVILIVTLVALVFAHLRVFHGQPIARISRAQAAALLGTALIVAGFNGLKDEGAPPLVATAYPPGMRLGQSEGVEATMAGLGQLRKEAEGTLNEPLPATLR